MTSSVSLLPSMTGSTFPGPSVEGLSDDEQALVSGLSQKLTLQAVYVQQRYAYYDGLQRIQNLGISIPPQFNGVRTVIDWPRVCVDPLVQRAEFAGFRLPKSTEIDDELAAHWDANDLDGELPLAIQDALVGGRGWGIVGAPVSPGDSPLVTVESPLNMTGTWDPRLKRVLNAYQAYELNGVWHAALYLDDESIYMRRDEHQAWTVVDRDQHRFGEPSVVRLPNRSRSSDRDGRSEITPPVMGLTDMIVRALLGMDIAREVYSVPHLYVLGASESDFVGADGTRKTALQMAMTKMLAFERDENGELPQVGQITAFDPSVFSKIVDLGGRLMASYTGFPPSYFGQTTTANPPSADAIRVAENGIDRRGAQVQRQATPAVRKLGQLMWRYANGGRDLPLELRRLSVDWVDARTPTPAATTDAVVKQISVGAIPATSDVTLAELGYSAVQRARLAQDRTVAAQLEAELVSSLAARQARAGSAIANDLENAAGDSMQQPGQVPQQQ